MYINSLAHSSVLLPYSSEKLKNRTAKMSDSYITLPINNTNLEVEETSTTIATPNNPPVASESTHTPANTENESKKTYFCAVCNTTVTLRSRGRHNKSLKHQRATGVTNPQYALPTFFCDACKVAVQSNNWGTHGKRESHQKAVDTYGDSNVKMRWCVSCAVPVQLNDWNLHCASAEHAETSGPDTSKSDQGLEDAHNSVKEDDTGVEKGARNKHKRIKLDAEATNPFQNNADHGFQVMEIMCDSCKRPVRSALWSLHIKTKEHLAGVARAGQDEQPEDAPEADAPETIDPEDEAASAKATPKTISDKGGSSEEFKGPKRPKKQEPQEWTSEEDEVLLRSYILDMLEDVAIAQRLPGRGKLAVLNRRRVLTIPQKINGVWKHGELYEQIMEESKSKD